MYSEKWALVKMTIFNRWGTAIYQGTEWDGNINDTPAPSGNYAYKLECKNIGGASSIQTGLFLLIR
jgi:gliding motility-associated-like protein